MKPLKKIGVVGHFAFGKDFYDGQTIKAKELSKELERQLTSVEVVKVDTYGGIKRLPTIIFKTILLFKNCKNVIMLPAHNGVKVFAPLFCILKKLFGRKIFYGVVGGWLPEFISNRKGLKKRLMSFDAILVETTSMKNKLEKMGFKNIHIMPNFKALTCVATEEIQNNEPYKLCTFSRVMKEKGIEDAVSAVKVVNDKFGREVFKLDIYGQIDSSQVEWFENLKKGFPSCVRYCGVVEFNKSTQVLKDYFALLFPTKFYTEGIPGTIIDALASGIPVITSKWQNYADIVEDKYNGLCYEFDANNLLAELLDDIADSPSTFADMKINCVNSAQKFMPENAIKVLLEML